MKYLLLLILSLAGCAHNDSKKNSVSSQPAVVLIHGAHFDAQAWNPVIEELKSNVPVVAIEYLAQGEGAEILLLDMAKSVCAQISVGSKLVAHSLGGAIVSQMIGTCPEKIERIIYVAAVIPMTGEQPYQLLGKDVQKHYATGVTFGKKKILPKSLPEFYKMMDADLVGKAPPEIAVYSASYSIAESIVEFDKKVMQKIPKYYIHTRRDQVVPLKHQKKYAQRTNIAESVTIDAGHLPFLTKPKELSEILLKLLN